MPKKQLDEKVSVGGGATGVSSVPTPTDKSATLPASHLGNGDSMKKIEDPNNPGEEETSTENNTKATKDTAGSNKSSVANKPSDAQAGQSYSFTPNSVKEDVEALFNGEDLTEEFKEKATTIFEAAVSLRVNETMAQLEEQMAEKLEEQNTAFATQLSEQVDGYMNYVVEQWMEENKVAIESSLRNELTEDFINKLRGLFVESYISIPEDKVDVLGEMATKLEDLEAQLNAAITENVNLKQEVSQGTREKILATVSEGLTATQAEKLVALAEGVDFDSAETFTKKLQIVKENYFPTTKEVKALTEEMISEETGEEDGKQKPAVGSMANYVNAITRTLKK